LKIPCEMLGGLRTFTYIRGRLSLIFTDFCQILMKSKKTEEILKIMPKMLGSVIPSPYI